MGFASDMWCLDLALLDEWRRLPDFPGSTPNSPWRCRDMRVWNKAAWTFDGTASHIWRFDLETETWDTVVTLLAPGLVWPYPKSLIADHIMQIRDGMLYVFGGSDHGSASGCNTFMALDLRTYVWTLLGGQNCPLPTSYMPMPRIHHCSWLVPHDDKLFVAFGNSKQTGVQQMDIPSTVGRDCQYDDVWSWHCTKKVWKKERIVGNRPSPRARASGAFNRIIRRTVLFGGYSTRFPAAGVQAMHNGAAFRFTYFADTFLWDPVTNIWALVLTPGFPTYRAGMNVIVDEDSGATYLFGGFTSPEFIPSGHVGCLYFRDLWQLVLDLPSKVPEADESWLEELGPWKICWACGSAGRWKSCGGTCGGIIHFCGLECLKAKWPEHKHKDGCRTR